MLEELFFFVLFKINQADLEFPRDEGAHQDAAFENWDLKAHLKDKNNPENLFSTTIIFFKDGSLLSIIIDEKNQKKYSKKTQGIYDFLSSEKLFLKIGENYWQETELFKYKLYYKDENVILDFNLQSLKPPAVIKNDSEGLYFVQPRVKIQGSLILEEKEYSVEGFGWIEHQTFTAPGFGGILGWKLGEIQFDNDQALMFYKVYIKNELSIVEIGELFVFFEDFSKKINKEKYGLEEFDFWKDPETNYQFPQKLYLTAPEENISLEIKSVMEDQIVAGTDYYEGSYQVSGVLNGKEVTGKAIFEEVIRVPSQELKEIMYY